MNAWPENDWLDPAFAEPDRISFPPVFVLELTSPPGWPWDQDRAARLEAHRGAPLPMANLTLQLRRTEPWRLAKPGRFAAIFIRTDDIGTGYSTFVSFGGRQVKIAFQTSRQRQASARWTTALLVGLIGASVLASIATLSAFTTRAQTIQQLHELERGAAHRLRQAQVAADLERQNRALDNLPDRGAPMSLVLDDLAKTTATKRPEVQIEGFHWRTQAFGVEVRGSAVPFTGNEARKLDKPLRDDVWVWAMSRKPPSSRQKPL